MLASFLWGTEGSRSGPPGILGYSCNILGRHFRVTERVARTRSSPLPGSGALLHGLRQVRGRFPRAPRRISAAFPHALRGGPGGKGLPSERPAEFR